MNNYEPASSQIVAPCIFYFILAIFLIDPKWLL